MPKSFYNEKIVETIEGNPLNFWYFNNGITAITDEILDFHVDSETISIRGIQIINGAQTVFSIHQAYIKASELTRAKMDSDALITMRIMRTGGESFDLQVTRYTNSQNPIDERDFHSNDEVQKRLQEDFFRYTDIWYETRRGEFRKRIKKSRVISNQYFAQAYLAYHLQDPFSAKTKRRKLFFTKKIDKDGVYDIIFNENTNYLDLLFSRYLYLYIDKMRKRYNSEISLIEPDKDGNYTRAQKERLKFSFIQYSNFEILALFKLLINKINGEKNSANNTNFLVNKYESEDYDFIKKYYDVITKHLKKLIAQKDKKDIKFTYSVYFKNRASYSEIKKYVMENLKQSEKKGLKITFKK